MPYAPSGSNRKRERERDAHLITTIWNDDSDCIQKLYGNIYTSL
jgi:hypothetical protein